MPIVSPAAHEAAPAPLNASAAVGGTLAAGTPLVVTVDQDVTTVASHVGDRFQVTVAEDVVDGGRVVIPKGTIGQGEVTLVSRRGGFGKPGLIGVALRDLALAGTRVAIDGHYREEGKSRETATAAAMFAVGIFSAFVHGGEAGIPKGRQLKARTGDPIAWPPIAPSPPMAANAPAANDGAGQISRAAIDTAAPSQPTHAGPVPGTSITTKGGNT